MALLIREELTVAHRSVLHNFCCGTYGVWCKYCDEWIKGDVNGNSGAFFSMRRHRTKVWLYFDDESNELVGFGSLGTTKIGWPTQGSSKETCAYIPQMAIDHKFQKKPTEPGAIKYCHQIIQDLILEAADTGLDRIILHVHPDNDRAVGLYERYNFRELPNYSDQHGNRLMLKWLK